MGDNKKENFEYEGTFKSISVNDFYVNQNNNIDSFGKCPSCDEEILNLETRECECGYRLDHDIPNRIKTSINDIKEDTTKILNYKICICGNKMGINSLMCKECYGRNKVNGNF